MRDSYHDSLDELNASLIQMTHLVGGSVARATQAVLDADLGLAETVITADTAIDELYERIEAEAFDLLARQQPVASDLRVIVTSLRMVADLERAGDYATHVAELARRRYPATAIPEGQRPTILEMGQTAQRIITKVGSIIASRDLAAVAEIERDDDIIDNSLRHLFRVLAAEGEIDAETAVDVILCGRYYERLADHAVSVARRIVYLVTGERHRRPSPAPVAKI
jgi:phosphate transport system protein